MLNRTKNKVNINQDNIVRCKGNLCYIYNKNFKRHLFISKEVLEYVKDAANQGLEINTFINKFENEEDKNYISKVIDKLFEIGYLSTNNNEEIISYQRVDSIHFMLTKKCNLNCIHCATSCSTSEKEILSLEDIIIILNNIAKLKPSNIVLTGGEPLLRDDLEQIVITSKELMPNTNLILATNGTLINDHNIHLLKQFDKIDISIDGVDEETCSRVRGNGVFNKVTNSIKFLQDNGFLNIHLSMVFGEKTNYLAKEFKNLNKRLNTIPVFRSFEPTGRGYDNYAHFNEDKHHLPINTTEMYKIKSDSRHISSCACTAFESNIYIDHNGDAYPCLALVNEKNKIINFCKKEFSTEELYSILNTKKERFKKILEHKDTKCENCDLNIFCWNCPAIFENAKNNKEIDIWCSRIKDNLHEIIWRQI